MKALDILKIFQSRLGASKEILENDEDETQLWDAIDEAIAELEALQAIKTCEGCVSQHNMDNACFICSRYNHDYYEPKESK